MTRPCSLENDFRSHRVPEATQAGTGHPKGMHTEAKLEGQFLYCCRLDEVSDILRENVFNFTQSPRSGALLVHGNVGYKQTAALYYGIRTVLWDKAGNCAHHGCTTVRGEEEGETIGKVVSTAVSRSKRDSNGRKTKRKFPDLTGVPSKCLRNSNVCFFGQVERRNHCLLLSQQEMAVDDLERLCRRKSPSAFSTK